MYQKRRNMENMLIWLIDIFCILCSGALAFGIRYGRLYGAFQHGDQVWLVVTMCLLYILINVFANFNHHFFRRGYFDELVSVVRLEIALSICSLIRNGTVCSVAWYFWIRMKPVWSLWVIRWWLRKKRCWIM